MQTLDKPSNKQIESEKQALNHGMRKEALAIAKISIYHETHETSKNKRSWNYYSESTFFVGC